MGSCLNLIEQTAIVQFKNASLSDISIYIMSGNNDISNSSSLHFNVKAKKDHYVTIRWKEQGNVIIRPYWKYTTNNIDSFNRGNTMTLQSGDERILDFK